MDLMIIIQILDIPGDQIFTKYWFYKVNYAISIQPWWLSGIMNSKFK